MNLVDCVVTEIKGEPFEAWGRWWLHVMYDSWGRPGSTKLMFDTKIEALDVKPGYTFLG